MFRQIKSKEEYDALLKEYTTQKDRVKDLLLNKKLSRSKLALELKENEISKLVALDQIRQEEIYKNSLLAKQQTIETTENLIDLDGEVERPPAPAPQEQKAQPPQEQKPQKIYEIKEIKNQKTGGFKYLFMKNGRKSLELNINKYRITDARSKYEKLQRLDNDYFNGEDRKNIFINNIELKTKDKRRGKPPANLPEYIPLEGEGHINYHKKHNITHKKHKKDDMNKLNLLIGSYLSGNDNIKLKKELVIHIKKMYKNHILTKSQYNLLMSKI